MAIPGWVQQQNDARNAPKIIGQAQPGRPNASLPPPNLAISNPTAWNSRSNEIFLPTVGAPANFSFITLPYNANRNYLFIQPHQDGEIWVQQSILTNITLANLQRGVFIPNGGYYEPFVVPVNPLTILWQLTAVGIFASGYVIEGTVPTS